MIIVTRVYLVRSRVDPIFLYSSIFYKLYFATCAFDSVTLYGKQEKEQEWIQGRYYDSCGFGWILSEKVLFLWNNINIKTVLNLCRKNISTKLKNINDLQYVVISNNNKIELGKFLFPLTEDLNGFCSGNALKNETEHILQKKKNSIQIKNKLYIMI